MNYSSELILKESEYKIKYLTLQDINILQRLYDRCEDFALMTDGVVFSSNAAIEEFTDVPKGKTTKDNYLFGLFNSDNILIGAIATHKHYPDNQTWWIGLMMLDSEYRNQGLGTHFYQAFENWVSKQNIAHISLCTIEANKLGLKFWQKMGFQVIRTIPAKQYKRKKHQVYVLDKRIS